MWPFGKRNDPNKIEIQLTFWGGELDPSFTVKLLTQGQTALEAIGFIQGTDFRLGNIKTEPAFRKKGFATTVVGTLIGVARARQCATFTLEEVSPDNVQAISIYRRFGAVALPPKKPGGHADYQIRL
jgi:ribosomal protein S18 acetylase RimI-like enzyme